MHTKRVGFVSLLAGAMVASNATCVHAQTSDSVARQRRVDSVYFEFQVDSAARVIRDAPVIYPAPLKAARVDGMVLTQFVVLEDGSADMDTFKILESTNNLFSLAARVAIPSMRFSPAELGGKKVRQLVQLPFTFKSPPQKNPPDSLPAGAIMTGVTGSVLDVSWPSAPWKAVELARSDSAHLPPDVYLESQVDLPVRGQAGWVVNSVVPPTAPKIFSDYAILEFIVNADGSIDLPSFKVLRATSRKIAEYYASGPVGMGTFQPAELHGKKVRQLVQEATFSSKKQNH